MNELQLSGGIWGENLKVTLKLHDDVWVKGRSPALPVALYASDVDYPCIVVTSLHTFIVIGGPEIPLKDKNTNSLVEFNSLTEKWQALPYLPVLTRVHACTLVTTKTGPCIMVAGGSYRVEPPKTVHLLDLSTEQGA